MQKFAFVAILYGVLFLESHGSECSHFRQNLICNPTASDLVDVLTELNDEVECQKACQLNSLCNHFSWIEYQSSATVPKKCFLFESCFDEQPCINCLFSMTGPPVPDFISACCSQFSSGTCDAESDDDLDILNDVSNLKECQEACRNWEGPEDCHFFTFIPGGGVCILYKNCPSIGHCETCMSGPSFPLIDKCSDDASKINALIFGGIKGRNATGFLTSVELVKDSYVCTPDMPSLPIKRRFMEAGWIGDDILVCGGSDLEAISVHRECILFNRIRGWENAPSMVERRTVFGMVNTANGILACGGLNERNDQLSSCEKFYSDLGWVADPYLQLMEDKQDFCMVVVDKKYLYVIGGNNGSNILRNVERIDVTNSTAEWENLESLHFGVTGHACRVMEFAGRQGIMVTGGYNGTESTFISQSQFYVFVEGTWEIPDAMNIGRVGHTMGMIGGTLTALGGYDGTFLTSVESFVDKTWTESNNLKVARVDHTMIEVRNDYLQCNTFN